MNKNKFPVLKISNIKWNQSSSKSLPKELELKWTCKDWNFFDVSNWLRKEYNCTVNDLNIEQIGKKQGVG